MTEAVTIEAVAREFCKARGVDPDAEAYRGVLAPIDNRGFYAAPSQRVQAWELFTYDAMLAVNAIRGLQK